MSIEAVYSSTAKEAKEIDRYELSIMLMLTIMHMEIQKNDFTTFSMMCDRLNINNEELVEIAHSYRMVFRTPSEQIFADMMFLFYNKSEENKDPEQKVIKTFYDVMCIKYPDRKETVRRLINLIDQMKAIDAGNFYNKNMNTRSNVVNAVGNFLLVCPMNNASRFVDNFVFNAIFPSGIINVAIAYTDNVLTSDKLADENQYYFYNGDNEEEPERVFESDAYERFLNKRKQELFDYVVSIYDYEATIDQLNDMLDYTFSSKATAKEMVLDTNLAGSVYMSTAYVLVDHYGGLNWLNQMTNDGSKGYQFAQDYHPDMEKVVRRYYMEYVKAKYRCLKHDKVENFTKIYLSRQCAPTPQEAYMGIAYLYNIDVLTEMMNKIKDEYYLNFSWEKITGKSMLNRYESIISELEDKVEQTKNIYRSKIESLEEKIIFLKNHDDISDLEYRYQKATEGLNKTIEEKDQEIAALRKQLASKDEYLALLSAKEEQSLEEAPDISALHSKRYLFVGRMDGAMTELKRTFSNSLFMENENMSLLNVKVDGIVMLIKNMSHGMFYKVMSSNLSKEVPIVRCNTNNVNTIYSNMLEFIM